MSIHSRAGRFSAKRKRRPPVRKIKFNKTTIPEGFVLKIDSREQRPLFIPNIADYKSLHFVVAKLGYGDYSFVGGESLIAVERKTKADFHKYVLDHDKTVKKLKAMNHLEFKGLTIECSENDMYDVSSSFSDYITREMLRGFLTSINLKYQVHVYFNADRKAVERWILDRLVKRYNILVESERVEQCTGQTEMFK